MSFIKFLSLDKLDAKITISLHSITITRLNMAMAANDSETEIHDQSTSSSQQNPGLFQLNAIIEGK